MVNFAWPGAAHRNERDSTQNFILTKSSLYVGFDVDPILYEHDDRVFADHRTQEGGPIFALKDLCRQEHKVVLSARFVSGRKDLRRRKAMFAEERAANVKARLLHDLVVGSADDGDLKALSRQG